MPFLGAGGNTIDVIIPAFFYRKKGYTNFVPKSVCRPSVCVCALVCASLELATSNFAGE